MNKSAAADAPSRCTRADKTKTIPSWAIIRPQNKRRFAAMALTSAGDRAISQAVAAVSARPRNIHPYTALRNAFTRSAIGSATESVGFARTSWNLISALPGPTMTDPRPGHCAIGDKKAKTPRVEQCAQVHRPTFRIPAFWVLTIPMCHQPPGLSGRP